MSDLFVVIWGSKENFSAIRPTSPARPEANVVINRALEWADTYEPHLYIELDEQLLALAMLACPNSEAISTVDL
jgi:hypothetical protein